MNINLEQLPDLNALFKRLNSGTHINRHQNNKLWFALEKNTECYTALFKALGFELMIDNRGFAYFKTEQRTNYTAKLTQELALMMLLLFEYQADTKRESLYRFEHWHIDGELINAIWKKYHTLLEAEEINNVTDIIKIFDSSCKVGFMLKENNDYRLLAAVHRYLDLFLELQEKDKIHTPNEI